MPEGNQQRSVLISGASIAGPALAWWLMRQGFKPTLIERSPMPRPGGHAVDVRGAGLNVLRAMNLEAATRERRTQLEGMSVLDPDGNEIWRSEEMSISGGAFGSQSIEILRDDLANILLMALPQHTEVIYGESVVGLTQTADGVTVTFQNSSPRNFDLVVGADGIGSNIRNLAFGGDQDCLHPFGFALAAYSAPNLLGLKNWQVSYELGQERCLIYTARENRELRVCLAFAMAFADVGHDRTAQMELVRQRCGHWGWRVPLLLDAMDAAPDFYLGPIVQVQAPSWGEGHVVLVGDAAYSPSPYTGQGTSLALVGAYVLASELSRSPDDHTAAFARYEATMRPFVEKNQALATLALDERLADPDYYSRVFEPALREAQDAIALDEI